MTDDARIVLFDLDGTLVDTAPDMTAALNRLREQEGLDPLPGPRVRNTVSKGSLALVDLGFGSELEPDLRKSLQQRFLDIYSRALCVDSALFDGLDAILAALENAGIRWGVVTNKPGWLTDPLLEQLQLHSRAACVVSGDTVARRKPHPDPLLHACEITGTDPRDALYLGDDERDVQAGHAAGMTTLIAGWGYIDAAETPQAWGADAMMRSVVEFDAWIRSNIIDRNA